MKEQKYKYSIIMSCYNVAEFLKENLDSIYSQKNINVENDIQIIVLNDGAPDDIFSVAKPYLDKYSNIEYYEKENSGLQTTRVFGLQYAKGEIINFCDPDDKFSEYAFYEIEKRQKGHPEVSIFSLRMKLFDAAEGWHALSNRFNHENEIIDLLENPELILIPVNSTFYRKEIFNNVWIETHSDITMFEDGFINAQIFQKYTKVCSIKSENGFYWYRKRLEANSISDVVVGQKRINSFKKAELSILNKYPDSKITQCLVIYSFYWLFNDLVRLNQLEDNKEFVTYVLNQIDNDLIINFKSIYGKASYNNVLQMLKLKNALTEEINPNGVSLFSDGEKLMDMDYVLEVCVIKKIENQIHVWFTMRNQHKIISTKIWRDDLECFVGAKEKVIITKEKYTNDNNAYYSIVIDENAIGEIFFQIKDMRIFPRFEFSKQMQLSRYSSTQFHSIFKDKVLILKNERLEITNYNRFKKTFHKFKLLSGLLLNRRLKAFIASILIIFMKIYYKKILNKNILLFADRLTANDDNAWFTYQKMKEMKNFKCFYVMAKGSNVPGVIEYGTVKHLVIHYSADAFISSHADNWLNNPFQNKYDHFLRSWKNTKFIFLQHGVTKADLSHWINLYRYNIEKIAVSTVNEMKNFRTPDYGYHHDWVALVGFPRFDNLVNNESKTILYCPTWRPYLQVGIDNATKERIYNPEYKNTEHFKMIDELLSNEKLNLFMKQTGRKMKILLHPNIKEQTIDFKIDNDVHEMLDSNTISYSNEISNCEFLITDYSSVHFDAGYAGKKVIYYRPDEEDFDVHSIQEIFFNCEKDYFGPIVKKASNMQEALLSFDSETYSTRRDKLFEFVDKDNTKRTIKLIEEVLTKEASHV